MPYLTELPYILQHPILLTPTVLLLKMWFMIQWPASLPRRQKADSQIPWRLRCVFCTSGEGGDVASVTQPRSLVMKWISLKHVNLDRKSIINQTFMATWEKVLKWKVKPMIKSDKKGDRWRCPCTMLDRPPCREDAKWHYHPHTRGVLIRKSRSGSAFLRPIFSSKFLASGRS